MKIQSSQRKQEQFTIEMKTNVKEVQMKRPCWYHSKRRGGWNRKQAHGSGNKTALNETGE